MSNDDISRYLEVIEDNVNVSKTNEVKDFFVLIAGIIGILLIIIWFSQFFANIFIDNMSVETQNQLESYFGKLPNDDYYNAKYKEKYDKLTLIRKRIIENDKTLQGRSPFPIIFVPKKEFNAWIIPNGSIYFTTELLDSDLTEEELAFVLGHEIGHYKNRDHLKTISRQIIINLTTNILFGSSMKELNNIAQNATAFEYLSHSQQQEKKADKYSSQTLIKLYGNNQGSVSFMEKLSKKYDMPEFVHYFSTHPSPKQRMYLLKNKN